MNTHNSTVLLVWYDPNMNSNFNHEQTKMMLKKILNNVQFYILETEFLNYIEAITQTSVVLILSGHVARDILSKTAHLEHLKSVHIFCDDKTMYQSLKQDFRKVKSISSGRDELKIVLETTLKHLSVFSYYNNVTQTSTWDLTTSNNEFIWFQLLQQKALLEQVADTEQAKYDFIQRCREYRGNNYEEDQKYINYLENEFQPEDAIKEYTNNKFLSKLVNHAIRIGDIEELYRLRYYIAHLCKHLSEESKKCREIWQRSGVHKLKLYRGQVLSQKERERLCTNENKYIAMRGFFSTTRDQEVAEKYAESSSDHSAVLFIITVELNQVPSMVLADIRMLSLVEDEEEILFGLNATFEIDEQFQDDRDRWIIKMHASNRGQEITNDYIQQRQLETSNCSSSSLISINFILAQLLIEMGQYMKAVSFLEKIFPTTNDERANHYLILADARISSYHAEKHALIEGIRLLKDSKDLFNSMENNRGVAHTLRRHADALVLNEQYEEAIAIYQESSKLYKQIPKQEEHIASCYNGLGDAYLGQRKYDQAKFYYSRALKKRQVHLPDEHPAIARSYYSLGRYYYNKGNNNENALVFLKEALERKKKIYPSDHPSVQCSQRLLQEVLAASTE